MKRGAFLVDYVDTTGGMESGGVGCSTEASPILGPTASGWTSDTRPGGLVGGSTRGDHSTKATRHWRFDFLKEA